MKQLKMIMILMALVVTEVESLVILYGTLEQENIVVYIGCMIVLFFNMILAISGVDAERIRSQKSQYSTELQGELDKIKGEKECHNCGCEFEEEQKELFCVNCGLKYKKGDIYCNSCGFKL